MKDGFLRLWVLLCLGESAKVLNFVNLALRDLVANSMHQF